MGSHLFEMGIRREIREQIVKQEFLSRYRRDKVPAFLCLKWIRFIFDFKLVVVYLVGYYGS